MPQFNITVQRTETYTDDITVEAETEADAKKSIQDILDSEGWDEVFDEDGEYQECWSEVTTVSEVK